MEYHLSEGRLNPRERHSPNPGHSTLWMTSPEAVFVERVATCFSVSRAFLVYAHCPNMIITNDPFHSGNIPV